MLLLSSRSSTDPAGFSSVPPSLVRPVEGLRPEHLRWLQAQHGSHLVSIHVRTAPDLQWGERETTRINALIDLAEVRVAVDSDDGAESIRSLRRFVASLTGQRTGEGLALFAHGELCVGYRLPTPVEDRVVVDPTFATRELARSLELNPAYRVLVLSAQSVRLYLGAAKTLTEVSADVFEPSVSNGRSTRPVRSEHRLTPERSSKDQHANAVLIRQVAQSLRAHTESCDLPLVVFAPAALAAIVRREPLLDPVDVIIGGHDRTLVSRLVQLARPALDEFLSARRERALQSLDDATRARRSAFGVHHVWTLACREEIDLLLVDEAFRYPAWTTIEGRSIVRAFHADLPDVLDDAVDEIIEMVQRSGGTVCFVSPGTLGDEGIAAVQQTMRPKSGSETSANPARRAG